MTESLSKRVPAVLKNKDGHTTNVDLLSLLKCYKLASNSVFPFMFAHVSTSHGIFFLFFLAIFQKKFLDGLRL